MEKIKYKIFEIDELLNNYKDDIYLRMNQFKKVKDGILKYNKTISDFANGDLYFGFHRQKNGYVYREQAPNAQALSLVGDFNNWDNQAHKMKRLEDGSWEVEINDVDLHLSKVKVEITANGITRQRIPLYIHRAVQDNKTYDFAGQVWMPDHIFIWEDADFKRNKAEPPLIYECHIGMAQEKEGIGTFKEFEKFNLPYIKSLGYNTIQLMAIAEHPYYASFGYQVSNFFAVSSRFGTPDDLKSLINSAHKLGISVIMDLVHSHSTKNINEGIDQFDGTTEQFFLSGSKGNHKVWDSKLFNYGKTEVIHFLLSNIKYWMSEYHFDGFRFDGVTSMIYHSHGLGESFDNYDKYFSLNTNIDAINYLQLANELIKTINKNSLVIAEDMSGMPGMALPVNQGGIGFDYRLAMGVPDFWQKTLKTTDENWDMGKMWYELTTRRPKEKNIGYCESHDQALVGDKTIMFSLADANMYWHMNIDDPNIEIDRAVALHKMIRAITFLLSGEGYLNFMGNEFGHPEWIDFPREGNGSSYKYARRQWSLVENKSLKYKYLLEFDKALIKYQREHVLMSAKKTKLALLDQEKKLIAFQKGDGFFIFNFNCNTSFNDVFIDTGFKGGYKIEFSSDQGEFGGFNRLDKSLVYKSNKAGSIYGHTFYVPARTMIAFVKNKKR